MRGTKGKSQTMGKEIESTHCSSANSQTQSWDSGKTRLLPQTQSLPVLRAPRLQHGSFPTGAFQGGAGAGGCSAGLCSPLRLTLPPTLASEALQLLGKTGRGSDAGQALQNGVRVGSAPS